MERCIFGGADSRFVTSQLETALHCNDVSHWPGGSLESAMFGMDQFSWDFVLICLTVLKIFTELGWDTDYLTSTHYNDVTWVLGCQISQAIGLIVQKSLPGQQQRSYQVSLLLAHCCGNPLVKGPLCDKSAHDLGSVVMSSHWNNFDIKM